jgi:uncharacterized protein YecT (DUF1311 family)
MQRYLVIITITASLLACNSAYAQSQPELNAAADAEYQKADARLNATYKKLLAKLDDEGKKKLIAAERAWVAYRDAQADFDADAAARGGSMEPMEYSNSCLELTEARIKQLEKAIEED